MPRWHGGQGAPQGSWLPAQKAPELLGSSCCAQITRESGLNHLGVAVQGWGQQEGEAHSGVVFLVGILGVCRVVLLLLEFLGRLWSVREVLEDQNEGGDNVKITCRVSFPMALTALEENLPAQGDVWPCMVQIPVVNPALPCRTTRFGISLSTQVSLGTCFLCGFA